MPKSKRIGRELILQKAREHAGGEKNMATAFDSFLKGVNWILDELDGKTIIHERTKSGDFVVAGTLTGCFTWSIKDIEYGPEKIDASRPLFIPLKTEFFNQFKNGEKTEELRIYNTRWNEKTCQIGREVTLSKGYGKHERLRGEIWKFKKQHGSTFGSTYKDSIQKVYGTLDVWIACISIKNVRPA